MLLISSVFHAAGQQKAEIIKFEKLDELIHQKEGKIKVVNFWATWCAPCIKELPYFEEARERYAGKISVNLISLDFADKIDKVNRFIEKKGLKSDVYLLDDIDYNSWIDKVDTQWSGAIPATLIINEKTGERKFVESELEEEELNNLIKEFLTKS